MRGRFASPFAPARKNILQTDGTNAPCAWARARGRNQARKTRAAAKGARAGADAHTRYTNDHRLEPMPIAADKPLSRLRGRPGGGPLPRQRERQAKPGKGARHAERPSPNPSRRAGGEHDVTPPTRVLHRAPWYYARNRDPPLRPAGSAGANGTKRHSKEERPCRKHAADGKGTGPGAPWIGQPYARTAHRLCGRRMQIMSRGRDAHFCAPPAQIRTWTLAHPAPTSGV